jgi:hydrogenase nickel incorporation protein HypA/HybF
MHEMSVIQEILDIAINKARESQAEKITQINLVIGEISSLVDDCLQFYFDFMAKGTIAQESRLSFQRIPLRVKCRLCGETFTPSAEPWTCPACQKWDAEITAGNEFYIDSIEIE